MLTKTTRRNRPRPTLNWENSWNTGIRGWIRFRSSIWGMVGILISFYWLTMLARTDEIERQIQTFCADCHALPNPASFERDQWEMKARKGFEFYAKSARSDLVVPKLADVIQYYQSKAPETIVFPKKITVSAEWSRRFQIDKVDWKDAEYIPPAISSITWTQSNGKGIRDSYKRLLVSDCRDGSLNELLPSSEKGTRREVLFRSQNPARIHPCDINQDGISDYIVAELGSIYPYDHSLGKVACLIANSKDTSLHPVLIQGALGRVADVSVGDVLGSTMPDIAVCEFGHQRTGSVTLLKNVAEETHGLQFDRQVLDTRPGAVRCCIDDFDQDGKKEIVVLMSQESECIELYINRGESLERKTIWKANDLTYGCVAMEVKDLDQDGRPDILFCNGDTFDNNQANASHGVQWLRNDGNFQFTYNRLLDMPGCYASKAGDMDGDGDLDIIVVANLPDRIQPTSLDMADRASVVLLINEGGRFEPVGLSNAKPRFAAVEIADFNLDTRMDFVVGAIELGASPTIPRLMFWWQIP